MTEITDKMRHCTKEFGLDLGPEQGAVQVLVNGPLISLVEGGISFLRDLGATLDFDEDLVEDSKDRKLMISGDMSCINATLKKLCEKFANEDQPNGDVETWFDPNQGQGGPRQREKYPDKFPRMSGGNDPAGKVVFRILLPASRAAVMIGKKGAVIRELRDLEGCKVEITDIAAPYKVCKVMGDSGDAVFNTIDKMLDHLSKAMEEDMNLTKGQTGIKFLVHQSLAGKIIGSKGDEIKSTREKSGCEHFKINGECIPNTTDRVVSAQSDDKSTIVKALRIVTERLEGLNVRGEERRLEEVTPRTDGKGGSPRGPPQHAPPPQQGPPQTYYGQPPPPQPMPGAPHGWAPPAPPQQYYQPPPQAYGAPPPVYGAPQGYGAPPPQQYAPPPQNNYYRQGPPAQVNSYQQQPPVKTEWQQRAPNNTNYATTRW